MNVEIKKPWITALRSGDYKQGNNVLHNVTADTYCCLGVLCDLAVKAGVIPPSTIEEGTNTNADKYFRSSYGLAEDAGPFYLPDVVREWAGLSSRYGDVVAIAAANGLNVKIALADHNDVGRTFEQIAQAIEEQL